MIDLGYALRRAAIARAWWSLYLVLECGGVIVLLALIAAAVVGTCP